MWAIFVSRTVRFGSSGQSTVGLPTFILSGDTLGITTAEQAKEIALGIVNSYKSMNDVTFNIHVEKI